MYVFRKKNENDDILLDEEKEKSTDMMKVESGE